jgi:hypothetical protein
VALGARATSDSVILGRETDELKKQWGTDLTQYGRLRERACQKLVERAKVLVAENELIKIPSVENIAVLALMEEVLNGRSPASSLDS